jgi:hypothetical protein
MRRTKEERKFYAAAVTPGAVLSKLHSYILLALQKHFIIGTTGIIIIIINY